MTLLPQPISKEWVIDVWSQPITARSGLQLRKVLLGSEHLWSCAAQSDLRSVSLSLLFITGGLWLKESCWAGLMLICVSGTSAADGISSRRKTRRLQHFRKIKQGQKSEPNWSGFQWHRAAEYLLLPLSVDGRRDSVQTQHMKWAEGRGRKIIIGSRHVTSV